MFRSTTHPIRTVVRRSMAALGIGCVTCSLAFVGCTEESKDTSSASMDATPAAISSPTSGSSREVKLSKYSKPGFFTTVEDERLWVLLENSESLKEFLATGEPAKSVTWVAAGPAGMSMRSDSNETLVLYQSAKPGYFTTLKDGRLWVLRDASKELGEFLRTGEPAKSYTMVGAGPRGYSIRSDSKETIIEYLAAKPGFVTEMKDSILWVFKDNSEALSEYRASGEPAKNVTWLAAGPAGISLRSDSAETLMEYLATQEGFEVFYRDGLLWVFQDDSEALTEFVTTGEPAKNYTRLGAGPRGVSIRSSDKDTVDLYLAAF